MLVKSNTLKIQSCVAFVAIMIPLSVVPAKAETYKIDLTRKERNLYKVSGKEIYLRTKYCYSYAHSATSIFESYGRGGTITFLDDDDECDVKYVLGGLTPDHGDYRVTINRDDDDLYEIPGTDTFIRTSGCYSYAMYEEASMTLLQFGIGTLNLADGSSCTIEGMYKKLRL
jgi:hypothetical protein